MNSKHPISYKAPGIIENDALYTKNEIKDRMGWKDSAFRQACRRGLRTFKCGKCVYVQGEDVIAYVTGKDEIKSPPHS